MHRSRHRLGAALAVAALPLAVLATAAPAMAQSAAPSAGAVPTLSPECSDPTALPLRNPGRLTLSTDIPAYPPWWGGDPAVQYPNEPEGGSGWELSDPYSGQGYESAVSYAVAQALGFGPDKVDWIANTVFENAFQPGPKPFDWHLAQIAILPERAEAVDFSDPYFDSNQSLVAMIGTPITKVTSLDEVRGFKLGAGVGTTAFTFIEDVIQPSTDIQVFPDNAAAVQALKNGQVDGIVTDLYSAFYMRDVQLEDEKTPGPDAMVVGQFGGAAPTDRMGMVLEKDSPLTKCVNEALAVVKASGQLQAIYDQWIGGGQGIPTIQ